MALSKESADALRECIRILARKYRDPGQRAIIARNAEQYIQNGEWLPAFAIEDVPVLFYPNDADRARAMHEQVMAAIESGELVFVPNSSRDRLNRSELSAWVDCPRVPSDSPLRYWLPAFMHEPAQAELPFEHWLQFDLWALREAAYLLCGRAPQDEREFGREVQDAGGAVGTMYRRLKDSTIDGSLPFFPFGGTADRTRVRPADVVAWADARGITVPDACRGLLASAADQAAPPEATSNEASSSPPFVTTGDLAHALKGCVYPGVTDGSEGAWLRRLGDPPKWMAGAREHRGAPGLAAGLWNPVTLALALEQRGASRRDLSRRFGTAPALRAWAAQWEQSSGSADYYEV